MNESTKNMYMACSWFASLMAQIPEYHKSWGNDFCVKEAREIYEKVTKFVNEKVNIFEIDINDLINVGFGWWDEEHTLLLCPLWLSNVYFPDKDHDHRGGKLAYGFSIVDGKIAKNTKSILD